MKHKFRNARFDVIILSDNDALDFMIKYRDDLFGKVPTVFCGINYFTESDLKGQTLYTGVNETIDVQGTIEVALKLHPSTRNIFVINDATITGKRIYNDFIKLAQSFQEKVRFEFLQDIEMEELLKKVENLPSDSLILYTLFFRDKAGKFYEYDESISLIEQRAKVPIYGTWDFSLGYGIVGGLLTSGYDQGRAAGKMALRILRGERIESIPVIMKTQTRYMFDYRQVERFGINLSAIPKESVFINDPASFYEIHKGVLRGILAGMAGLILVVIVLIFNIRRRKIAENELRKARDELEAGVQQRTAELLTANRFLQQEIEEHEQAQVALLESERKLFSIVQGSFIPSFVIDREHRILYWNRAIEELTGLRSEDMVGTSQHWRAFYSEQRPCMADLLVDHTFEAIPRWYAGKASQSSLIEDAYDATDFFPELGDRGKWLRFTASIIKNSEGNIIGATETLEDITERKSAEDQLRAAHQQLKESRQQLSDIIDFLPDPTFVIDQERRVIAWNRAMEEMTGIKAADMLGRGDYEYALPFYGKRRPILIDLILNSDENIEATYSNITRKGLVVAGDSFTPEIKGGRVLFGTASALRDSSGKIVGAIESIRDVTERRRVEEALSQAEEKYRTIFENAIEGIFQTTPDGRFLSANPAFARILGYESPDVLMNSLTDIARQLYVHPENRSELLRLVGLQNVVREFETRFYRKDGSIAWVTLNIRSVCDHSEN